MYCNTKVKRSSLTQTCKFFKCNAVDSLCGSCYIFISILHEKLIARKIIRYNKDQTKAKTKIYQQKLEKKVRIYKIH